MRTGCEEWDRVLSAFAVGLLDPDDERYRRVTVHLRDCSECWGEVLTMRGLASIVAPFPALLDITAPSAAADAGSISRGGAAARREGRGA